MKGGYWDGKIAFCPVEGTGEPSFELSGHSVTVTVLTCDSKEHILISGAKNGEVIVWKNHHYAGALAPPHG